MAAITISATQQAVVDKLRDGWTLQTFHLIRVASRVTLTKNGNRELRVGWPTFDALLYSGVIVMTRQNTVDEGSGACYGLAPEYQK